jgi:hypothetical protein
MLKAFTMWFVLVLTLGLGSASSGERTYPTNIELVEQAIKIAADSMKLTPPAGGGSEIEIEISAPSDAAWLIENVLKEKLIGAGWNLKARPDSTDSVAMDTGFALRMRIVDLGLIYGKSWRRYLVVGKRVQRIARASVFYDLVDRSQGVVLASSDVNGEVRDVVPSSALPSLADSKYGFASPTLDKSQWDRYVEGGLVLAIVGVLIYLFYSNKTAS